jgi:hypothetical protein
MHRLAAARIFIVFRRPVRAAPRPGHTTRAKPTHYDYAPGPVSHKGGARRQSTRNSAKTWCSMPLSGLANLPGIRYLLEHSR